MDGMKMAIFPYSNDKVGGALVAGDDLAKPLERVEKAGGKIIMLKTFLSHDIGYIAMFIDCESNRLALHSPH